MRQPCEIGDELTVSQKQGEKEFVMRGLNRLVCGAFAPMALLGIFADVSLHVTPAQAVVYCRAVGVPKGCVGRAPVVARRDYGRRGTPLNRGGPVNRIGRR